MTNYKFYFIIFLASLSYSQSDKMIPPIVYFDGVVYKSNEEIQTFQLTSRRLTELSKSSLVTVIIFFVEGNFLSLQRQKCSLR